MIRLSVKRLYDSRWVIFLWTLIFGPVKTIHRNIEPQVTPPVAEFASESFWVGGRVLVSQEDPCREGWGWGGEGLWGKSFS